MVRIEGTYISIKGGEFIDFCESLGVSKEIVSRLLASHWTLRIWRDEDTWGVHLICSEMPHLNVLERFSEGKEKHVEHRILGGKAKIILRKLSSEEGVLSLEVESEKFGKMTLEGKFMEEGLKLKISAKGKTVTELWEHRVKMTGSYMFEKGENVEKYMTSLGDSDMLRCLKDYKMHIVMKGERVMMVTEHFGELGNFTNMCEVDKEMPYITIGDKWGETPRHSVIVTRGSVGKYIMMYRSKSGLVEEWLMIFNDTGLLLIGTEKKSGLSCKIHMKRFHECIGTYKMVSMVGLEKYISTLGLESKSLSWSTAHEMTMDHTSRLVIMDMGNGSRRLCILRKVLPLDFTFKMNEEFTFHHPLLREDTKAVATKMDETTLLITMKTSKGKMIYKLHFNPTFIVMSVSLPESDIRYKMVFERSSFVVPKQLSTMSTSGLLTFFGSLGVKVPDFSTMMATMGTSMTMSDWHTMMGTTSTGSGSSTSFTSW